MSLPNISPQTYSLSAVTVGYILIANLAAEEQNALGNWLMLVGQYITTNAFFQEVQESRKVPTTEETISLMQKTIDALKEEVDNLKR